LSLLIGSFSVSLLYYVGYWTHFNQQLPFLQGWGEGMILLFGPSLYLYLKTLKDNALPRKYYYHFFPFLIIYFLTLPLQTLAKAQKIFLFKTYPPLKWLIVGTWEMSVWLQLVSLFVYAFLLFRLIKEDKLLLNRFALEDEKIRNKWLQTIVGLYVLYTLSLLAYYVMVWVKIIRPEYDYALSGIMSLTIYVVGFMGFWQPKIFQGFVLNTLTAKYEKSSLTPEKAATYAQQLEKLMQTTQPYLDSELKIADLAEKIGISTHHLSQVLNEELHTSFADYLHKYRIETAKQLLLSKEAENNKILAIAFDVGYSNKATFNAAFKKQTGYSPTEFRKVHFS
ncbi:MAG: helix-turn-helix domain-containing protein, partial [Bacteroidia bacterium]